MTSCVTCTAMSVTPRKYGEPLWLRNLPCGTLGAATESQSALWPSALSYICRSASMGIQVGR